MLGHIKIVPLTLHNPLDDVVGLPHPALALQPARALGQEEREEEERDAAARHDVGKAGPRPDGVGQEGDQHNAWKIGITF